MSQHLVITAIGADRPGICNQIVKLVGQNQGNIIDSRIALFGSEFTLTMLISGNQNNIARIETALPVLGQQHGLITLTKRTTPHTQPEQSYRLEVQIQSEDRCGLTEQFTQFFADLNIGLFSLSAQTQHQDGADKEKKDFYITIIAHLDSTHDIPQLEESFYQLCTSLQVQGSLNITRTSQASQPDACHNGESK